MTEKKLIIAFPRIIFPNGAITQLHKLVLDKEKKYFMIRVDGKNGQIEKRIPVSKMMQLPITNKESPIWFCKVMIRGK